MWRRRSRAPSPAAVESRSPTGTTSTSRKRKRSPPTGMTSISRKRKRSPTGTTSISTSRERASPVGLFAFVEDDEPILVLLETPSGFAIFSMHGCHFKDPDAMENIWAHFGEDYRTKDIVWLEEFKTFEDKSSAINHETGVNSELSDMINRCCPWQLLAVGNLNYKRIIETSLGIPCVCNEIVMEVMWGLKNLMHILVPEEKLKLRKEDRLPLSQGLKRLLDRYGFHVKPRMVNEAIILVSCVLHDSDFCEKKLSTPLHEGGHHLKEVSGINSEGWSFMKLVTALKIIADPRGTTTAEDKLFTEDELSTLYMDAHKYDGKLKKSVCLEVYNKLVEIYDFRDRAKKAMAFLVKEAKTAYKAKRRAAMRKPTVKLAQEAQSAKGSATKKLLFVKVGPWATKNYGWIPLFRPSKEQSY